MWQAQQPEQPPQTTVIQRARSDVPQSLPLPASGAPAAAVSTGFSAFSQQRDAMVSPSPQVPFRNSARRRGLPHLALLPDAPLLTDLISDFFSLAPCAEALLTAKCLGCRLVA